MNQAYQMLPLNNANINANANANINDNNLPAGNEYYNLTAQELARTSAFIDQVYNLLRTFHKNNAHLSDELSSLVHTNGFTSVGGFVGTLGIHRNSFVYDTTSASEFCKEIFSRINCENPNTNVVNVNYVYNFLIFIKYVNTIANFVEYTPIMHQLNTLLSTICDLVNKLHTKYP